MERRGEWPSIFFICSSCNVAYEGIEVLMFSKKEQEDIIGKYKKQMRQQKVIKN